MHMLDHPMSVVFISLLQWLEFVGGVIYNIPHTIGHFMCFGVFKI